MESPDARKFARIAHELHDQPSLNTTLDALVASTLSAVGCEHAGVIMARRRGTYESAVATDPVAREADCAQVELRQGPGISAIREKRTEVVRDLRAERRWRGCSSVLSTVGVRSVLAVRLWTNSSTLGALTLYHSSPGRFDEDAVALAEILSRHASIALAHAREGETLWRAVDARKLVGQAQGILMERFDLDDRKAFDVLRRYSQDMNLKLNEVARILIDTRKLPE